MMVLTPPHDDGDDGDDQDGDDDPAQQKGEFGKSRFLRKSGEWSCVLRVTTERARTAMMIMMMMTIIMMRLRMMVIVMMERR